MIRDALERAASEIGRPSDPAIIASTQSRPTYEEIYRRAVLMDMVLKEVEQVYGIRAEEDGDA